MKNTQEEDEAWGPVGTRFISTVTWNWSLSLPAFCFPPAGFLHWAGCLSWRTRWLQPVGLSLRGPCPRAVREPCPAWTTLGRPWPPEPWGSSVPSVSHKDQEPPRNGNRVLLLKEEKGVPVDKTMGGQSGERTMFPATPTRLQGHAVSPGAC